MIETLLSLWLLPAIGTFFLFRLMVHAEGNKLRNIYTWQINSICIMSVLYPVGLFFLMLVAGHRLCLGWKR